MLSLPNELVLNILRYCDWPTLREIECASRQLHQLIVKNSHRLARMHIDSLEIFEGDPNNHPSGERVQMTIRMKNLCGELDRHYKFSIERDLEKNDGESLSTPDAARDLIEGLYKGERWQRTNDIVGDSHHLKVADPIGVAMTFLDEIFKRTSIHRLCLDSDTPTFLSSVLAMLQKHRMRIHYVYLRSHTATYEDLAALPSMLTMFGAKHLHIQAQNLMVSEEFAAALSETKLVVCERIGTETVPTCLFVKANLKSIKTILEIVKEWARGEREIVRYHFVGSLTAEETFAGIVKCLENVRGLRTSIVDGEEKFVKIEKTTLPESVQHQRTLYAYGTDRRSRGLILSSAPLEDLFRPLWLDGLRPCVECTTTEKLRQAADLLAAFHAGHAPTERS